MKKMFLKFVYVACAAIIVSFMFVSCSKNNDDGGGDDGSITDPNTVATENLIAHWGFENSPKDEIGQRGIATSAVTYVKGQRGRAYQGAKNAYISFDLPKTDKLAQIKTFTIAMWIKAPKLGKGGVYDGDNGIPCFFQLANGSAWEGALSVFQENMANTDGVQVGDSINLKGFFAKEGAPWAGQWWDKSNPNLPENTWFHFIIKYDNSTSIATLYVNGGKYKFETLSAYSQPIRYQSDPGDANNKDGAAKLGDLVLPLNDTGNKGMIGYWAIKAFFGGEDEWQTYFRGNLDELRVYNKALSDTEMLNLYNAEISQLN